MVKTSSLVGLGLFAGVGVLGWSAYQSGSESTESAQSGGRGGSALTPQALREIARSGKTNVTFESPETNFPDVGSDASGGSKKEQKVQTTSSDSIGDFATAPDAQSDAINEASNEQNMSVDPVLRDDSGDPVGTRVAGVVDDPAVSDSGGSKKMSRLPEDDEAQQESESRILSLSESRGGDDSESDESDSESKKMSRVKEDWL